MTERMGAVLFRDTSLKNSPVFYWYSSGNYRRYFSDETPLTSLFFRLNAVNAAIFPVNNGFCGQFWPPLTPYTGKVSANISTREVALAYKVRAQHAH